MLLVWITNVIQLYCAVITCCWKLYTNFAKHHNSKHFCAYKKTDLVLDGVVSLLDLLLQALDVLLQIADDVVQLSCLCLQLLDLLLVVINLLLKAGELYMWQKSTAITLMFQTPPYPHASMGMLWEWLGEPVLFWVEGFWVGGHLGPFLRSHSTIGEQAADRAALHKPWLSARAVLLARRPHWI